MVLPKSILLFLNLLQSLELSLFYQKLNIWIFPREKSDNWRRWEWQRSILNALLWMEYLLQRAVKQICVFSKSWRSWEQSWKSWWSIIRNKPSLGWKSQSRCLKRLSKEKEHSIFLRLIHNQCNIMKCHRRHAIPKGKAWSTMGFDTWQHGNRGWDTSRFLKWGSPHITSIHFYHNSCLQILHNQIHRLTSLQPPSNSRRKIQPWLLCSTNIR